MQRELFGWYSPSLQKEMPIAIYGHYGFALLMVPTAAADYLEYERFQLLDYLKPMIEAGKCKVYSIDSINKESWMNNDMLPEHKAIRQNDWNRYVYEEVVPFIRNTSSENTMIYTCGASFGALHSMNLFLKRPDILNGVIALSGVYDLMEYTKGFYDEQVFYNSPAKYMPGLSDPWFLDKIRSSQHIHILTGSGTHEDPGAAGYFANILYNKNIWYDLQVWGTEWTHDWPTWYVMLPNVLNSKF